LEQRLLAFYGVGPVTVNIFCVSCGRFGRRLTRPLPAVVQQLAERPSVDLSYYRRKNTVFARVKAG
jgi:hypothetical protein